MDSSWRSCVHRVFVIAFTESPAVVRRQWIYWCIGLRKQGSLSGDEGWPDERVMSGEWDLDEGTEKRCEMSEN